MRKPRQDKRESELSEAAVQHLAEEANAIDEGDERLGIEPSKPSKMVLGWCPIARSASADGSQ